MLQLKHPRTNENVDKITLLILQAEVHSGFPAIPFLIPLLSIQSPLIFALKHPSLVAY